MDNVAAYNNLSETFNDFKFKVLRPEHKSYYSQQDIDEMNECRTTPNTGLIQTFGNVNNVVEIDISKAYSSAFGKSTRLPMFNKFAIRQEYKGEKIQNFHL